MRRWRVVMVLVVALVLLVVHAHDIVFGMEHWPSSNYPMYSRVESRRRLKLLALVGEVSDGKGTRLVWLKDERVIPEISERRLRNILLATRDLGPARERDARFQQLLSDYFNLYEARRILGRHSGPPLLRAHLFELTWKFREGSKPRERPDQRRLLASSESLHLRATSRPATIRSATIRPATTRSETTRPASSRPATTPPATTPPATALSD